jgi:hypothetical protein
MGGALARAQQMFPAEDVQRQITVMAIVAVKEALFLLPMQGRVGDIQIEHYLRRRGGVCFQKNIHQQSIQAFRRVANLVIALVDGRLAGGGQLHPVQGALTGQRLIDFPFAGQQSQERIVAQLLMVIHILVAQRQPVDALCQHLAQFVLEQPRRPSVGEATRHSLQQTDLAIGLPQQQSTPIAAYPAAVEMSHHLP